ncbi:MAG TPA: hypothetical protein VKV73_02505 [Chloroflexota bacterium]|nr:hypothetical protein [Chloroflexota bacterium]
MHSSSIATPPRSDPASAELVDHARQLPIDGLIRACREETERYLRGERHADVYGLELFKRAVTGDRQAWDGLVAQYRPLVLAYLRRHPAWTSRGQADDEYWVTRTFQRFVMAVKPDRLPWFPTLSSLLAYLKLCSHSVLLDEVRAADASRLASLEEVPEAPTISAEVAHEVLDELSPRTLWDAVAAELRGGTERVVARLSWVRSMKPVEIYSRHPEMFDSVADVYRVKRTVLGRLRRSGRVTEILG